MENYYEVYQLLSNCFDKSSLYFSAYIVDKIVTEEHAVVYEDTESVKLSNRSDTVYFRSEKKGSSTAIL